MRRKQLDQMTCSIAKALDVVGDPWTMLVIRDALPRTPSGKIQKFMLREEAKAFSAER